MCAASVHAAALHCLMAADPGEKIAQTRETAQAWREGLLRLDGETLPPRRVKRPGRPPKPELVHPRELAQRGLGSAEGRAALIHAVAHIELNAIDLAWDAVYRFRGMPAVFYDDWIGVAEDEARHHGLLVDRLRDHGYSYGDFPAHNGLWDMAVRTDACCLTRMALVPRVLEARGLDVTPAMIERFRAAGDAATADILETILDEEVAHVAAGSRWFGWCCEQRRLDPLATFRALLAEYAPGMLRPPFNVDARTRAGFSDDELALLLRPA